MKRCKTKKNNLMREKNRKDQGVFKQYKFPCNTTSFKEGLQQGQQQIKILSKPQKIHQSVIFSLILSSIL